MNSELLKNVPLAETFLQNGYVNFDKQTEEQKVKLAFFFAYKYFDNDKYRNWIVSWLKNELSARNDEACKEMSLLALKNKNQIAHNAALSAWYFWYTYYPLDDLNKRVIKTINLALEDKNETDIKTLLLYASLWSSSTSLNTEIISGE